MYEKLFHFATEKVKQSAHKHTEEPLTADGTLTFKTDINCAHCIEKVSPVLNNIPDIEKWEVDTADEQKTLTVYGAVSPEAIRSAVSSAGFRIE